MSTAPSSYLVFDPGRTTGFAMCKAGGADLKHGTWKFQQPIHGEAFATYANYLKRTLSDMPDPLVVMEKLTFVAHKDAKGGERIDPDQIAFSAGWYSIAKTVCFTMGFREPDTLPIQTWRAKTIGAAAPKTLKVQAERSKWFKQKAKDYCDAQGWSYSSADEAEALCMLDAVRMIHETGYAFDKGRSYLQESFLP